MTQSETFPFDDLLAKNVKGIAFKIHQALFLLKFPPTKTQV